MISMNRRDALKSFALSTGTVVSAGTVASLLQSCQSQSETSLNWTPQFFTPDEAAIISRSADIIIPRTDTPGALDVAVPQFIDLLYKDVFTDKQAIPFKQGIAIFNLRHQQQHRGKFLQADAEQQMGFVESLYTLPQTEEQRLIELIKAKNPGSEQKSDHALYTFLVSLRELTIKAYFTSESVGEQHLSYLPIPGEYDGDYKADGNTKVWSL